MVLNNISHINALSGIPTGFLFGMFLQKSRMSKPENIRNQLKFKDWTMMKTFLSAAGASSIALGFLDLIGQGSIDVNVLDVRGNLIGGSILGLGMAVGGACPGTVLAQMGEGLPLAKYTLGGSVLGATIYGLLTQLDSFNQLFHSGTSLENPVAESLNEYLGISLWSCTIPIGLILLSIAYGINYIFPKKNDEFKGEKQEEKQQEESIIKKYLSMKEWSPILSGIGIGSLQIPVNLLMKETLGTSSAYVTASTTLLQFIPVINQVSYFSRFSLSIPKSSWQLISDTFMVIGSYFSSWFSNSVSTFKDSDYTMNEKVRALLGGFLLVFGARCAGGCTSGHGLSGLATQSFASYIAVASMMGTGMAVSLIYDSLFSSKNKKE